MKAVNKILYAKLPCAPALLLFHQGMEAEQQSGLWATKPLRFKSAKECPKSRDRWGMEHPLYLHLPCPRVKTGNLGLRNSHI